MLRIGDEYEEAEEEETDTENNILSRCGPVVEQADGPDAECETED